MALSIIAGIVLCAVLAHSVAFALHEVVGHGMTAIALGGRFNGFFISPTAAFAETTVPDNLRVWVNGAGTPVNLATGLVAWVYLRRTVDARGARWLRRVALWHFVHLSLVMQLLYIGGLPLAAWWSGQRPQGDWGVVFNDAGISPLAAAAVALPLAVCAGSSLAIVSLGLTPWPSLAAGRWGAVRSYLSLAGPPTIALLIYALVVSPWARARDYFELGGVAATLLTAGLLGAVLVQRYEEDKGSRPRSRVAARGGPDQAVTPLVTILLVAAVAALLILFGPTVSLRRGVAVQQPLDTDYFRGALDIRAELVVGGQRGAELSFVALAAPDRGSPYIRRLTRAVAALGPSAPAALEFTRFFAERNLGLSATSLSELPTRVSDGWRWATLTSIDRASIPITIWPNIYSEESRVVEMTLKGVTLQSQPAGVPSLSRAADPVVWRRPSPMNAPITFIVAVP